jgi:hypothetical protein
MRILLALESARNRAVATIGIAGLLLSGLIVSVVLGRAPSRASDLLRVRWPSSPTGPKKTALLQPSL